jgi:hypothetical protein
MAINFLDNVCVNTTLSATSICSSNFCGTTFCGTNFYGNGCGLTNLNVPPTTAIYIPGTGLGSIKPLSGSNTSSGFYSIVLGGVNNSSLSSFNAIGNGCYNYTEGRYSLVGNGSSNCITQNNLILIGSTILNGFDNSINNSTGGNNSINNTIIAGSNNLIDTSCFSSSINGCGQKIGAYGCYATLINGCLNNIGTDKHSTIANGCCNQTLNGNNNFIGAGVCNLMNGAQCSTILNGLRNCVGTTYLSLANGFIAGGCYNTICSGTCNSYILGCNITAGTSNTTFVNNLSSGGSICSTTLYVNGTQINPVSPYAFSNTGTNNIVTACTTQNNCFSQDAQLNICNSVIGSGYNNTIATRNPNNSINSMCNSVINGGSNNCISAYQSSMLNNVIGGGDNNKIYNSNYAFIANGNYNSVTANNVFVLGSGLSANQSNFTYVNNLSSQGVITTPTISATNTFLTNITSTNIVANNITANSNLYVNGNITTSGNIFGLNPSPFTPISGNTYSLQLSDNSSTFGALNAGGLILSILGNISYPTGYQISMIQLGGMTAQVYVSGGYVSGVGSINVNSSNGYLKTSSQYSAASLIYTGATAGWVLYGDLSN